MLLCVLRAEGRKTESLCAFPVRVRPHERRSRPGRPQGLPGRPAVIDLAGIIKRGCAALEAETEGEISGFSGFPEANRKRQPIDIDSFSGISGRERRLLSDEAGFASNAATDGDRQGEGRARESLLS